MKINYGYIAIVLGYFACAALIVSGHAQTSSTGELAVTTSASTNARQFTIGSGESIEFPCRPPLDFRQCAANPLAARKLIFHGDYDDFRLCIENNSGEHCVTVAEVFGRSR